MNEENNCVWESDYRCFVTSVTTITFYLLFDNVLSFHKKSEYLTIDEIRSLSVRFSIEIIIPVLTLDIFHIEASLVAQRYKKYACNVGAAGDVGLIPGLGRSPKGGHAAHSSILAWRMPGTEQPGRLQSIGLRRVRHDWSDLPCMHACTCFILNSEVKQCGSSEGSSSLEVLKTSHCLHIMSCIFSCTA